MQQSSVLNNLPAVFMVNLDINDLHLPYILKKFLALSNIAGANIDQRIAPMASLATLL